MLQLNDEDWARLFTDAHRSAWHLEMRDQYAVDEEADDVAAWRSGEWSLERDAAKRKAWLDLMRVTAARGVQLRRARVVSEPVTEYIRFEHAGTPLNVEAGEDVRWLPRTLASTLSLPGNDLWLFDGERVLFNHFTGDGGWVGCELIEDPALADRCAVAFEQVWQLATPHDEFRLT